MVTAHPDLQTEPAPYVEDERDPWQRARELLDAGYDWQQIKACMQADYRARITFAKMLDDEDMAWLADVKFRHTVTDIEDAWISEEEMIAFLEELDRRDGQPFYDYRA